MSSTPYRVLARAYRPRNFDDLIGQDVLVRTLTNAFASGRIAHAFLLTGIRGIGKTTTARIIARGLNCTGPDGNGGPTTTPCGECANCKMILEDRHMDVIEMDAASRTGVDDIRDIIDMVQYAPANARYKIFIIDEVHMLSKNAFNALLKTLEEPPAHVKFIFATTELRKIPITIVSRCQRFDLRRIEIDRLSEHLANICEKESVTADAESLKLIATAAEGSVRDSLSLLDQAIAMSRDAQGHVVIAELAVRDMLGLADKTRAFTLLEHVFTGKAAEAVQDVRELYQRGGDPVQLLSDLLSLTHFITRISLAEALAQDVHYSDIEQQRAKSLATKLDMAALTRAWQMLLKGLQEVKIAPQPLAAAEMILIRLAYASTLPSPDELIRKLEKGEALPAAAPRPASSSAPSSAPVARSGNLALATRPAEVAPAPAIAPATQPLAVVESFLDAVALFNKHREALLYSQLKNDVRLVRFTQGRIEVRPVGHVNADFAARISRHLTDWTQDKWLLTFSDEVGEPTLREQEMAAEKQRFAYAEAHPAIDAVRQAFGDIEILKIETTEETL